MSKKLIFISIVTCILGTHSFAKEPSKPSEMNPYVLNNTLEVQVIPIIPSQESLLNPPLPNEIEKYEEKGYGLWKLEKSNGYEKRTDILPIGVRDSTKSVTLTQFFTMSDIHIVDIQSTTQPLFFGEKPNPGMQSAYTGSMLYSTQILNAAVQTLNLINKKSKIDFGLMLGDAANNAQKNEVQMYIDVLTGKMVNPNSNPLKTYSTDYMQPFQAEGLVIPWFQLLGNHDHFWEGSFANTDKVKRFAVSDTLMRLSLKNGSKQTEGEEVYGGVIDPSTQYGKIVMSGISNGNDSNTHKITPNNDRKVLDATDFVNLFPKGHGIKSDNTEDPLACYVVEPNSNIPIRIIVLDNTAPQETTFIDPTPEKRIMTTAAMSFLSKEKLIWLEKQMEKAQTDNKLIIVATHIPLGIKEMWSSTSEVKRDEFINTLLKYPNMSLLLAGHRHLNTVIPFESSINENAFWQVETASLRDFPQQFKMIKINLNNNGTISILANSVDPIMEKDSMMEKARTYAIAASQIYPEPSSIVVPKEKSRVENVELFKKLSPKMEEILNNHLK